MTKYFANVSVCQKSLYLLRVHFQQDQLGKTCHEGEKLFQTVG